MITPSYNISAQQNVFPKTTFTFLTGSLDARITFTRSTTATYYDSTGVLKTAAINEPRFDYDPNTLTIKGLLIESSKTNYITYSEDLNNGAWSKQAGNSVASNTTVAPDGNTTADTITWTSAAVNSGVYNSTSGLSASTSFARSIWVKADVAGGTVGLADPALTQFETIVTLTTTWQRVTLVQNSTAGGVAGVWIRKKSDSPNTIQVWGAQLEQTAFATSYIPNLTTGSSTRAADVALVTGTNFSNWYNSSKGTFRTDFISVANGPRPIISVDDDTANNSIIVSTQDAVPTFVVTQNGSEQANVTAGTITANTNLYAYTTYDSNYFGIARAASRQIDTSGTVPTVDRMRIGFSQAGAYLNNCIRSIQFWA